MMLCANKVDIDEDQIEVMGTLWFGEPVYVQYGKWGDRFARRWGVHGGNDRERVDLGAPDAYHHTFTGFVVRGMEHAIPLGGIPPLTSIQYRLHCTFISFVGVGTPGRLPWW
jgi:hypothetical protein